VIISGYHRSSNLLPITLSNPISNKGNRLELKSLISFVAIADRKSFIRAAEYVQISQPAITAQIQRLEEEVGVRLLDRNRRSVKLTQAGETFLLGAIATLAQAEETIKATQRVALGQSGRIRVGFPPSVLQKIMPAIMIDFHRQHPHIKLDLFSLHTTMTIAALQKQTIDIGYVRLPVEARGLKITPIQVEPLMVCLPASHRLAHDEAINIRDLHDEHFIVYERRWAPGFHDTVINLCLQSGFTPLVAQEVDEMYVVPTLVATGVGVAIIPNMVMSSPVEGVVIKPIRGTATTSGLGVAVRATDTSPLVKCIVTISQLIGQQNSTISA
jgi:DNA-binding transcriptional LysR family regulator